MSDRLDTIQGCVEVLTGTSSEIAEFQHEWLTAAGEVAKLDEWFSRAKAMAHRNASASSQDRREGEAYAALVAHSLDLLEQRDSALEALERCKTRFRALERRASSAQSALQSHRTEARTVDYVA